MKYCNIPRIVLAAPQSSSGKTTVVTGILGALYKNGLTVQPFKIGPDYIDPSYHTIAAHRPGHNLDTWLVDEQRISQLFAEASVNADIAIIEGVMGLYDGGKNGISSTAELAKKLNAPIILVINCRSMGDSAAALALGFREYDPDINLSGVILNCLGSATHEQMIRDAMGRLNIPVLGAVQRDDALKMPERHLGLTPAGEKDTTKKIAYITEKISRQVDLKALIQTAKTALPLPYEDLIIDALPSSVKIAVAKDEAFSFYYAAGLNILKKLGARIEFFSPIHDTSLPECDAVILGGGFPELFVDCLASNISMLNSIKKAAADKIPLYAECGGFMYLMRQIKDFTGKTWKMANVIPADAIMQEKLQTVGYVTAQALTDNIIATKGQILHGHEFHFSMQAAAAAAFPWAFLLTKNRTNSQYKAGYYNDNILASYFHLHFLGSIKAAKRFIQKAVEYKKLKTNHYK